MKKRNITKHVIAILMVLCVCVTSSVTAFAQEKVNPISNDFPVTISDILSGGGATFTKSVTFTVELTGGGNYFMNVMVALGGNPEGTYEVAMTTPGGKVYTEYTTANSTTLKEYWNLAYASEGTYTFKVTLLSGPEKQANIIVQFWD